MPDSAPATGADTMLMRHTTYIAPSGRVMSLMADMIRVIVADDHEIVRAGVRMLLAMTNDISLVGEAEDGASALALVSQLVPSVALLDLEMPRMDGLTATRAIVSAGAATKVLVLTMHAEVECRARLLAAGAAGYLSKSAADRELVPAIRTIAAGGSYEQRTPFAPAIATASCGVLEQQRENFECLNPWERVVFRLVAGGWSRDATAAKLRITADEVDDYRERIADKLGVTHRADYLRLCLRLGLPRAEAGSGKE